MDPIKLIRTVAIVVMLLSATVFALTDSRVKFPRGRTSATISGRVGEGGRVCYFAGARQGQKLTATVISRSGKVQIFESGDELFLRDRDLGRPVYLR